MYPPARENACRSFALSSGYVGSSSEWEGDKTDDNFIESPVYAVAIAVASRELTRHESPASSVGATNYSARPRPNEKLQSVVGGGVEEDDEHGGGSFHTSTSEIKLVQRKYAAI